MGGRALAIVAHAVEIAAISNSPFQSICMEPSLCQGWAGTFGHSRISSMVDIGGLRLGTGIGSRLSPCRSFTT